MKNYRVIKDYDRYTIGEYIETANAYIINDGICQYYWWGDQYAAQEAADAYNEYEGPEWLGQHGYGNDRIPEDYEDENLVNLYRLFDAVDPVEGDD